MMSQCRKHDRHQEFLHLLRRIDADVPSPLDVPIVMNNCATVMNSGVLAMIDRDS
jgi:hypothetical protein